MHKRRNNRSQPLGIVKSLHFTDTPMRNTTDGTIAIHKRHDGCILSTCYLSSVELNK